MPARRARRAFAWTDDNGVPRVVKAGDIVDAAAPCVQGREALFEPLLADAAPPPAGRIEEATAPPGDRRELPPPRAQQTPATAAKPARRPAGKAAPKQTD